ALVVLRMSKKAESTCPSRKLAIGLPLLISGILVASRLNLNSPASPLTEGTLFVICRYSTPNFNVWRPLTQVSRLLPVIAGAGQLFSSGVPWLDPYPSNKLLLSSFQKRRAGG